MDDVELELRRRVSAAERARAYIEDPLLLAAFDALETRCVLAWRRTEPADTHGREQLWQHIQALGEVRSQLAAVLEDGLMARDRLDDLRAGITNP